MKRKDDQEFIKKDICKWYGDILDACQPLMDAIEDFQKEHRHQTPLFEAAGKIGQLEDAINKILRPATINCLRPLLEQPIAFDKCWKAARDVLSCLCLLAVKPDWINQASIPNGCLDVEVETLLGLQIIGARYQQTRLTLIYQPGSSDLPGEHAFRPPLPPPDPLATIENEVDRWILSIWPLVYPADKKTVLTEKDINRLNAFLGVRQTNQTHNHFLPFRHGDDSWLNKPEFVALLSNKLSHLTIVRLKALSGMSPLLTGDENNLLAAVLHFLDIPNELGFQP